MYKLTNIDYKQTLICLNFKFISEDYLFIDLWYDEIFILYNMINNHNIMYIISNISYISTFSNYFKIKYVKLTLLIYRNLKVTKIQVSN